MVEKVRIQSHDYLDRFNERLWLLTRYLLAPYARFDEAGRDIDRQKDALLDEISGRLEQQTDQEPLFTLRWSLL